MSEIEKHSPQKIVEILHSIKSLSIEDGQLDVWFKDSQYPESPVEFVYGSFTRQLLELIESHLLDEQDTGSSGPGLGQE